ncbi:MAG: L,D-transpeptidase/peptidoglycan binding protein, partial [Eggerthellaceae bacterium]|nr:L,D-transpeptidase/peptidoglycan binding protein [Eggerthellaceae bacterium]
VLVGVAYAVGWWYFSNHYYPNTTMSGTDISYKTAEEVAGIADSIGSNYSITIKGDDAVFTISAKDVDAGIDGSALATKALKSGNPLIWPIEMQQSRDYSDLVVESFSAGGFEKELKRQVDSYNETATDPKDAFIEFDEAKKVYSVHPEESGTKLREEPILAAATEAIMTMQSEVAIPEDASLQPEILQTDERLVNAVNEANTYSSASIALTLGDTDIDAGTIDSGQISQWVSIGEDYKVSFDEEAMLEWTRNMANGMDTIGTERTYTRPDGATFTVSGGTYGWEVDTAALVEEVGNAIKEGFEGSIRVPTISEGVSWNGRGTPDWGAYADVSIGEQHARFYDASGNLVWESDVITGEPDGEHDTPVGIWRVLYKESPSILRGEMLSSGVREYETEVQYWAQFTNSGCGFHDATWQWAFGGNSYANGYGSHGCVNLPYDAAEALYDHIAAGNAVIVHE